MKLIILLIFVFIPGETVAQDQLKKCFTNFNAPPAGIYYWPPDTKVKVYLERGMFTSEQLTALLDAMKTWSDTAAQTGAGISFSYAGEIAGLATCDGCLTVARREVHKLNKKAYALFSPWERDRRGQLVTVWIDFDFATTKPKALQALMAHELGHGMGLWDCMKCKKKRTIMSTFPGINSDNGLIGPSPCDLEVVRQVYEFRRRLDQNAVAGREQ